MTEMPLSYKVIVTLYADELGSIVLSSALVQHQADP